MPRIRHRTAPSGRGVIFQVVQRHQFRANDIADFFCRHFGVAGTGTVKQTYVHNVNVSIPLSLRAVYQKGTAIRHNATIRSRGQVEQDFARIEQFLDALWLERNLAENTLSAIVVI
jgi:hypothetical protein